MVVFFFWHLLTALLAVVPMSPVLSGTWDASHGYWRRTSTEFNRSADGNWDKAEMNREQSYKHSQFIREGQHNISFSVMVPAALHRRTFTLFNLLLYLKNCITKVTGRLMTTYLLCNLLSFQRYASIQRPVNPLFHIRSRISWTCATQLCSVTGMLACRRQPHYDTLISPFHISIIYFWPAQLWSLLAIFAAALNGP